MSAHVVLGDLPADLSSRPLAVADADAVAAVVGACEKYADGVLEIVVEDIRAEWARPSIDLANDSVGVFDGDRLIGCAEIFKGRRVDAFVLPEERGRGIGTAMLRWTQAKARAEGSTLVGQTVSDNDLDAVALLRADGYQPLWTSWILRLESQERPVVPPLPDGITLREFVPGQDEHAAYTVVENAFNEWPDRDPALFEDWAAGTVQRPGFEPWHIVLAEQDAAGPTGDPRVVGVSFAIDYGNNEGWVHQLAVDRELRGRGLGKALLQHAFGLFHDRGARGFELSTDSRTGALGLYEHLGMKVRSSYTQYALTL
jgi:mycothiol synthase